MVGLTLLLWVPLLEFLRFRRRNMVCVEDLESSVGRRGGRFYNVLAVPYTIAVKMAELICFLFVRNFGGKLSGLDSNTLRIRGLVNSQIPVVSNYLALSPPQIIFSGGHLPTKSGIKGIRDLTES